MKKFLVFFGLFSLLLSSSLAFAQEPAPSEQETLEGVIKEIRTVGDDQEATKEFEVLVTKGSLKGQRIKFQNTEITTLNAPDYAAGDRVLVVREQNSEGKDQFTIVDYVRREVLFWLTLIFVALVALIGRFRGMTALLGMSISFLVIFYFLLPRLLTGAEPVSTALLASLLIAPVTFYLSHGFNRKTSLALLGTLITFIVVGILAKVFVDVANLTGFASEEAGFLQAAKAGALNLRGILLAGMLIGMLGVLDDITISQAAIVEQLKAIKKTMSFRELYFRAMSIGRDHIASLVNTLILVYTGAALPLLLLFLDASRSFLEVVNYEAVAEEIVRTLIGSIGLILAVPVTTLVACFFFQNRIPELTDEHHYH